MHELIVSIKSANVVHFFLNFKEVLILKYKLKKYIWK